ncbi:MAG: VOC family protein, partial [Corynebacterium casei]
VTGPEGSLGINGAIMQRDGGATPAGTAPASASNAAVFTMGVESFDATAKKILAAGGTVVREKYALPGMAWQVYFLDLDGNVFGIHEPDESAS